MEFYVHKVVLVYKVLRELGMAIEWNENWSWLKRLLRDEMEI